MFASYMLFVESFLTVLQVPAASSVRQKERNKGASFNILMGPYKSEGRGFDSRRGDLTFKFTLSFQTQYGTGLNL